MTNAEFPFGCPFSCSEKADKILIDVRHDLIKIIQEKANSLYFGIQENMIVFDQDAIMHPFHNGPR